MQGCGYAVRRRKGIGHMAQCSNCSASSRGFVVFTPYAGRHRVLVPWFLSHPVPLRIWEFAHC